MSKDSKTALIISIQDKFKLESETLTVIQNISGIKLNSLNVQRYPDIHIVRPTGKIKIGLESITDVLHRIKYKPYSLKVKIVVIFNAEKLTIEAQNKLLKTLEEPPDNTHFILSTTNHHKLLDTIISRCELVTYNIVSNINSDIDIVRLINLPFYEQCDFIETISKIKDSSTKREEVNKLLSSLTSHYHNLWVKNNYRSKVVAENIKLISLVRQSIDLNASLKLALETLFLNLK